MGRVSVLRIGSLNCQGINGYYKRMELFEYLRKSALSIKLKAKSISVIESLNFKNPKTKSFINVLSAIGLDTKKTLFVTNGLNKNVYLSARNLNKSEVITDSEISTYKIMNAQHLVIEENVIEKIESNLG